MKDKIFLIYILFLAFVSCAKAENFKLTENGRSNSTIIIDKNTSKDIYTSAKNLQYYIEKISGCKVPIVNNKQNAHGILIYIGNKKYNEVSTSPPETCYIESKNNNIYLSGANNTATAYAVYTFIENELGIRWFAPGTDWEYIPALKSKDLEVSFDNYTIKPDISPRFWSSHNYNEEWDNWNQYNKTINPSGKTAPWRDFQNNIFKIFPPEKYTKKHPEYYPLINGKRRIPLKSDKYWWPCIGNPDVQKLTIEYIKDYFKKNSSVTSFSLGMDDVYNMCECDLCKAMDAPNPNNNTRNYTDRYYTFVNIVAKEIKKTYPEKYIGTLIYLHTQEPPQAINHIEDNVFGYMTQDWAKWSNDSSKKNYKKQTKDWKKYINHLSRYNYIGFNSIAPRFFPHSLDQAMKFDSNESIEGMYSEIYTFLPHTAPMIWAFSKLQWNTSLNIDDLLDEFYNKMYETSNKEMKKYYELLENCWDTPKDKYTKDVYNNPIQQALVMDENDLKEGFRLLNQALNSSNNQLVKNRITIVKDGLTFYSFYVKEYALLKKINSIQITNGDNAKKVYTLIEDFKALTNERHLFWNKVFKQKNILGVNATAFNKNNSLEKDILRLESLVLTPSINLIDWYQQNNEQKQLNKEITVLVDNFPDNYIKESLTAYQKFSRANINPKSISTNILGTKWTTWSRIQSAEFHIKIDENKTKEYVINSMQRRDETGIYLQNINNLKPGATYMAKVMVKTDPVHSENVTLGLRLRAKNQWYTSNIHTTSIKTTAVANSNYQTLIVTITLPKDADGISFQMNTNNATAQFKNPELYKID